jgi:polyisoprenoid-binding protein YceI
MKNKLLVLLFCLCSGAAFSQQNQWICKKGETGFFSETVIENISAQNKNVVSIIDIAKREIAVRMNLTDFKFQNHLMEEHFNENYVESEKYPVSTFKGKIQEGIDWGRNGTYDISARGALSLHGVTKDMLLKGKVSISNGQIILLSNMDIVLKEFNIEVPSLLITKVSEVIAVKNKMIYVQK